MVTANRKKLYMVILITVIMLLLILMIGPWDKFSHGFYSETFEYDLLNADELSLHDLSKEQYRFSFKPIKKHFAGFELVFCNESKCENGVVEIAFYDEKDICIEKETILTQDIESGKWYKIYADKEYEKGKEYVVEISLQNCESGMYLQLVDSGYLMSEQVYGEALISYAYAQSTFDITEKILICSAIVALWMLIISKFFDTKIIMKCKKISIFCLLVILLSWNYMYNSFDNYNVSFDTFQHDSETLVIGTIYAEKAGVPVTKYGLGRYMDVLATHMNYKHKFANDEAWKEGYSKDEPVVAVANNLYTNMVAKKGNKIQFSNGEVFEILKSVVIGNYVHITLDADTPFLYEKYGSLLDARFLDDELNELAVGKYNVYVSQYGLQGKIFKYLARIIDSDALIQILNLLCSLATSIVLVLLVCLIQYKYNRCMAAMFFVTFMLSPWIVNFARNLYWVEFTWFLPMLIGLICSIRIKDKSIRIACYIAVFVVITCKCLCGYEYISSIMLSMVSFLIADFVKVIVNKQKNDAKLYFKTIFIMGNIALLGFVFAICIHAQVRGQGDLFVGIKTIIKEDVLRRTNGANLNNLGIQYWPSLNASIWETFCKYFDFSTEIITGLRGNLFPVLCVLPLVIFGIDYKRKKLHVENFVLYMVFFMAATSWFVLAKSHSYIHTHMNFVLWYLGFIQIVLYVIVDGIYRIIQKKES